MIPSSGADAAQVGRAALDAYEENEGALDARVCPAHLAFCEHEGPLPGTGSGDDSAGEGHGVREDGEACLREKEEEGVDDLSADREEGSEGLDAAGLSKSLACPRELKHPGIKPT